MSQETKNFKKIHFMKKGDKCKVNEELINKNLIFTMMPEKAKTWVKEHRDQTLTIDQVNNNGYRITFIEDENDPKFWFPSIGFKVVESQKTQNNHSNTMRERLNNLRQENQKNKANNFLEHLRQLKEKQEQNVEQKQEVITENQTNPEN